MTLKQRQYHLSKVSSALVKECDSSFGISDIPLNDLSDSTSLSISVDDAHIQSVPKEVLHGIWGKAKELISMPGQVVEGPCSSSSNTKCYVVASKTSDRPHIVQHNTINLGSLLVILHVQCGNHQKFVHTVSLQQNLPIV